MEAIRSIIVRFERRLGVDLASIVSLFLVVGVYLLMPGNGVSVYFMLVGSIFGSIILFLLFVYTIDYFLRRIK